MPDLFEKLRDLRLVGKAAKRYGTPGYLTVGTETYEVYGFFTGEEKEGPYRESGGPYFEMDDKDIPTGTVEGSTIEVYGVTYEVHALVPDGEGSTNVVLHPQ